MLRYSPADIIREKNIFELYLLSLKYFAARGTKCPRSALHLMSGMLFFSVRWYDFILLQTLCDIELHFQRRII